jgi:copper(I)-binding protein
MTFRNFIVFVVSLCASLSVCLAKTTTKSNTTSPSTQEVSDTESPNNSNIQSIILSNAWARPSTSQNNNSAIYLDIRNDSDVPHNLVNWSADVANTTELHDSFVDEKGVSKMVRLDKLVIPAKTDTVLKPGSTHIMLLNLKRPLNIGDKFNLTLYFDDNTQQITEVEVK